MEQRQTKPIGQLFSEAFSAFKHQFGWIFLYSILLAVGTGYSEMIITFSDRIQESGDLTIMGIALIVKLLFSLLFTIPAILSILQFLKNKEIEASETPMSHPIDYWPAGLKAMVLNIGLSLVFLLLLSLPDSLLDQLPLLVILLYGIVMWVLSIMVTPLDTVVAMKPKASYKDILLITFRVGKKGFWRLLIIQILSLLLVLLGILVFFFGVLITFPIALTFSYNATADLIETYAGEELEEEIEEL